MLNTKVMEQVSDLMIQALSDESIKMAQPLTDVEIKLLNAVIEQTVSEGHLKEELSLVSSPKELINLIDQKSLDHDNELRARKTLRRFFELYINLTAEPQIRILN
ncbi:MAG: hypothetical protein ACOYXC_09315 [Candidatus Rifleibacteriota bacterium]